VSLLKNKRGISKLEEEFMDTMKSNKSFDFDRYKEEAIQGLYERRPCDAVNGAFTLEKRT
jgi:hypothetical protein